MFCPSYMEPIKLPIKQSITFLYSPKRKEASQSCSETASFLSIKSGIDDDTLFARTVISTKFIPPPVK